MKDFLGQKIRSGDTIVYPTRRSPVSMNRATVLDVKRGSLRIKRALDGKVKPLTRVDNVVVVTKQLGAR